MDATINPGDAKDTTPQDGVNELLLAAVARQVAVCDPQFDADAAGLGPSVRNAELLLPSPFEVATFAVTATHAGAEYHGIHERPAVGQAEAAAGPLE